jgi:hypothetical protein
VKVAPAGEEAAEVLPPLRIKRDDLAIENHFLDPQLVPDPVAQPGKLREDVAALRAEVAVAATE